MIKQAEYSRRRKHLMQMAGPDSVVVLSAAPERFRNNDTHYPYRQNSDFHYLTGFNEPEAVLVLLPEGKDCRSILFCRERDAKREMWDGPMAGLEGAVADFKMDEAFPITELDKRMPAYLEERDKVYYGVGHDTTFDQQVIAWLNKVRGKKGVHAPDELVSVDHDLHEMRLYKSRAEISAMRKSAKVAVVAHEHAMQTCRPGMNEAETHAGLLQNFYSRHCRPSYEPIVGAGNNGCILHYIANDQPLNDGDLLLIDAGAEYDCYASDVTRTFPVNGRFSAEQKALYEVVLETQRAAIEKVSAGQQWIDVQNESIRVTTEGLVELGLLKGKVDELIEQESHKEFYVHNVGHWLGLDVHDVGDYQVDGHSRALEPGMVMTVEPGIYIANHREDVDQRWRGIGIRIEDNVLVTKNGPDVLTGDLVKTIDDIEALMAS